MLKFYLTTVLIYIIVIICALIVMSKKIIENGWVDKTEKANKIGVIIYLLATCAIPVFRFIVLLGLMMMYGCTKDQIEDIKRNNRKDDE